MKFSKSSLCALPLILLSMYAYASPVNEAVPIVNKPVPREGLAIHFNTIGHQRVVCTVADAYKATIDYVDGNNKYNAVVGGTNEFYFTNVGETAVYGDYNLNQVHVEKKGVIRIQDAYNKGATSVTCFYIPESNSGN